MEREREKLLVRVIDLLARRFDKQAVLHGGMVLRVLGCERLTNDVDYVFIPFKSKKDIVPKVIPVLEELEGAEVSYSLNSKCLRVIVTADEASVQIEIKSALEIPTSVLSTKALSSAYNMPPRLIPVLDYSVALAEKMAAWNERRLVRDIYDIWFYLKMGVTPDKTTLERRLARPYYSRLVAESEHFQGTTSEEFITFLSEKVQLLTDDKIADALADYLPPAETAGLAMPFRTELAKLR